MYDCARKSNNWLDQYWAPEVDFSPFRALSRRQMAFPFCCQISLLFILVGKICPFWSFVPFPARPNRKSRSSIFLPSETKRKRLLRTLPKFTFLTLESDVLESDHILSLGCLCFKRKLPEVLTFAEWKAPPWRPSFHLKITCYSHANELISISVIVH